MMVRVLKLLRRVMPLVLRRRLRRLQFEWLSLDWHLSTGIRIHLCDYADWVVYNEIFVSGEYDQALAMMFDAPAEPGRHYRIVDLGANTGFFTLRATHEARRREIAPSCIAITSIEAHAACVARFRDLVLSQPGMNTHVSLVHGLVGERAGDGLLYESSVGASSSTHQPMDCESLALPAPSQVPYVDLSALFAEAPRIDLLKCDIEGSEQRFIENYPDVLAKVQMAVFEFHRDLCDVELCQRRLREYGFTHHTTFRKGDATFTYGVWR